MPWKEGYTISDEITLFDDIEKGGPVPYRNLIWA